MLVDTYLGCIGAIVFFQKYISLSQVLAQMIWQFISASLTDNTEKIASKILLATLILQLLLDCLIYLLPYISVWFGGTFGIANHWVLLVTFVIRFGIVQQVTNSVLKIFKMRIQLVLGMPLEQQLSAFNNVSVFSDLLGRVSSILVGYVTFLILYNSNMLSFDLGKNIFFGCIALWDIIGVVCCITMTKDYFLNEVDNQPEYESILEELDFLEEVELEDEEELIGDDMSDLDDPEVNKKWFALRFIIYFKRSLVHFIRNRVLLFINLHLWSITLVTGFVTIVLKFAVTDPGEDKGSRSNFCNGQILYLVENQLYSELTKIGGAIMFQIYMTQLRPRHYYRYIYCFFSIVMAVLCGSIFLNLGPTGGSVTLALINVLVFLGVIYDANMSGSIAHQNIVGFVYGIQGSITQLLSLAPIGFVHLIELGILTQKAVIGLCVGFCIWAALLGLFISFRYGLRLENMFEEADPDKKTKCKRCLFG